MIENYKSYTIKIQHDDDSESPREWENLGTMYCFHRRNNFGDKHNLSLEDCEAIELNKDYICLPIYMYEHGGCTISTRPFSCPWDSGKLGIIAVSLDKIRKEYNVKRVTSAIRNSVIVSLNAEVHTYNDFITGNVFYYTIDNSEGETVESCSGFYGEDYCLTEAKTLVDYLDNKLPKQLELPLVMR